MRRYLSDNQVDDGEFPDHSHSLRSTNRKYSSLRRKRPTADEYKTKEDAFDNWIEALNNASSDEPSEDSTP